MHLHLVSSFSARWFTLCSPGTVHQNDCRVKGNEINLLYSFLEDLSVVIEIKEMHPTNMKVSHAKQKEK